MPIDWQVISPSPQKPACASGLLANCRDNTLASTSSLLVEDGKGRNWEHERSSPVADIRKLFYDFLPHIPGQDHDSIRTVASQMLFGNDGYAAAREILALLGGVSVGNVGQQVGLDAGVVEECIALGGCSVAGDPFALTLLLDEEGKQVILDLVRPWLTRQIGGEAPQAMTLLRRKESRDSVRIGSHILDMTPIDAQAAAMGGQFFRIE